VAVLCHTLVELNAVASQGPLPTGCKKVPAKTRLSVTDTLSGRLLGADVEGVFWWASTLELARLEELLGDLQEATVPNGASLSQVVNGATFTTAFKGTGPPRSSISGPPPRVWLGAPGAILRAR
jgi:hypothetical protein